MCMCLNCIERCLNNANKELPGIYSIDLIQDCWATNLHKECISNHVDMWKHIPLSRVSTQGSMWSG